MSKNSVRRQTKKQGAGVSIGGNADTGGGDIVGGNLTKGNVTQSHGIQGSDIKDLFAPIYQLIDLQTALPQEDQEDLKANVDEIQVEVAKGSEADQTFIERRIRNIARMAPDILDITLKTISNPILGLATLAQKIAARASGETTKSSEVVKKNNRS